MELIIVKKNKNYVHLLQFQLIPIELLKNLELLFYGKNFFFSCCNGNQITRFVLPGKVQGMY